MSAKTLSKGALVRKGKIPLFEEKEEKEERSRKQVKQI